MGIRGSFVNVENGNFTFSDDGMTYRSIGGYDNIRVLIRTNGLSVKAPEISHSPNRIYAIVQGGALKHIAFYDNAHQQSVVIDLLHPHYGLMPHKHLYLNHSDNGIPLTPAENTMIKNIKRRFHLK